MPSLHPFVLTNAHGLHKRTWWLAEPIVGSSGEPSCGSPGVFSPSLARPKPHGSAGPSAPAACPVSSAPVTPALPSAWLGTRRELCIRSSPGQYGLVAGSVRRRGTSGPVLPSHMLLLNDSKLSKDVGLEESGVTVIGSDVHAGYVSCAGRPASSIPERAASGRGAPMSPLGLGHSAGMQVGASPGGVHHRAASGAACAPAPAAGPPLGPRGSSMLG
mmetsp:Transcript_52298/g.147212  ORF Transcript_52298/g.147212 Transcript_52298/m.147212 type:complete len:217 (-) Transcript_52298:130-780(-)